MAKIVDITEKLNCEENPRIKVRDRELEVNADAGTMLKIMGVMADNEKTGAKEVITMYELLFGEETRKKIEEMKLKFSDFQMLVSTAINLVTGESGQGEQ